MEQYKQTLYPKLMMGNLGGAVYIVTSNKDSEVTVNGLCVKSDIYGIAVVGIFYTGLYLDGMSE